MQILGLRNVIFFRDKEISIFPYIEVERQSERKCSQLMLRALNKEGGHEMPY